MHTRTVVNKTWKSIKMRSKFSASLTHKLSMEDCDEADFAESFVDGVINLGVTWAEDKEFCQSENIYRPSTNPGL